MKSQVNLLTAMLRNWSVTVGFNPQKDIETVIARSSCEGDSFLEITLPHLDDLLLEGLSSGLLPSHEGWKSKPGTKVPAFLSDCWVKIFDPNGSLRPAPDINSIRAIRQISRTFKKVFEVCSDDRVASAVEAFVSTDRELSNLRIPKSLDIARDIAQYLFGTAIGRTTVEGLDHVRHGPGATAESFDSVERWEFPFVSQAAFSIGGDIFRTTWDDLYRRPIEFQEIPARLEAVPKTATKPRLISIEPSYTQFLQQGFHAVLKRELGQMRICSYLDQFPNQELARKGSIDGSYATIDLSEASDRVHFGLVRSLFSFNSTFVGILENTRSRMVRLPDHREILLNKFASMGSALTFPVETMVFTTLAVLAVCRVEGNYSRRFVRQLADSSDLRVYGDDIIVPSKYYPTLVSLLVEYGLKINSSKSFSTGLFRESCGADWFGGHDVTPIYVRRRLPQSERDSASLVSLSSFRNQWVSKYGYGAVQEWCDDLISHYIPYPASRSSATGEEESWPNGICRVGPEDFPVGRWNKELQRLEVRAMCPVGVRRRAGGDDYARLSKSLRGRSLFDTDHLWYHGRPVSAKLKYRWCAVG